MVTRQSLGCLLLALMVTTPVSGHLCTKTGCYCPRKNVIFCAGAGHVDLNTLEDGTNPQLTTLFDCRQCEIGEDFIPTVGRIFPNLKTLRLEGADCTHIVKFLDQMFFTIRHTCTVEPATLSSEAPTQYTVGQTGGADQLHMTHPPTEFEDGHLCSEISSEAGGLLVQAAGSVTPKLDPTKLVTVVVGPELVSKTDQTPEITAEDPTPRYVEESYVTDERHMMSVTVEGQEVSDACNSSESHDSEPELTTVQKEYEYSALDWSPNKETSLTDNDVTYDEVRTPDFTVPYPDTQAMTEDSPVSTLESPPAETAGVKSRQERDLTTSATIFEENGSWDVTLSVSDYQTTTVIPPVSTLETPPTETLGMLTRSDLQLLEVKKVFTESKDAPIEQEATVKGTKKRTPNLAKKDNDIRLKWGDTIKNNTPRGFVTDHKVLSDSLSITPSTLENVSDDFVNLTQPLAPTLTSSTGRGLETGNIEELPGISTRAKENTPYDNITTTLSSVNGVKESWARVLINLLGGDAYVASYLLSSIFINLLTMLITCCINKHHTGRFCVAPNCDCMSMRYRRDPELGYIGQQPPCHNTPPSPDGDDIRPATPDAHPATPDARPATPPRYPVPPPGTSGDEGQGDSSHDTSIDSVTPLMVPRRSTRKKKPKMCHLCFEEYGEEGAAAHRRVCRRRKKSRAANPKLPKANLVAKKKAVKRLRDAAKASKPRWRH